MLTAHKYLNALYDYKISFTNMTYKHNNNNSTREIHFIMSRKGETIKATL